MPGTYVHSPELAQDTGEGMTRRVYLHPVDPLGGEQEVWKTRHRSRTCRKNIMAYHWL